MPTRQPCYPSFRAVEDHALSMPVSEDLTTVLSLGFILNVSYSITLRKYSKHCFNNRSKETTDRAPQNFIMRLPEAVQDARNFAKFQGFRFRVAGFQGFRVSGFKV